MNMPNIAELEQQAKTYRTQAEQLRRAHADGYERHVGEQGGRIDATRAQAVGARAAAEASAERAVRDRDRANDSAQKAREAEAQAAREAAKDAPDADKLGDYREQAQMHRATAAGLTNRAEQAERAAREDFARADKYDQEADGIREATNGRAFEMGKMHDVAEQLDQKAFGYEKAIEKYNEAVHKIDSPDYDQAMESAQIYHRAADSVTIDYSGIETDVLIDLGMTKPRVADEFAEPTAQASTTDADPVAGNYDTSYSDTTDSTELAMNTQDDAGTNSYEDAPTYDSYGSIESEPSQTFAALDEPAPSEPGASEYETDFAYEEPMPEYSTGMADDSAVEFTV